MQKLSKIFFIYSEASVAVMMVACAVIELLCSFYIDVEILKYLVLSGFTLFTMLSLSLIVSVYRDAKRSGIIS